MKRGWIVGMVVVVMEVLLLGGLASAAFVDNHDGTVTDTVTGLMWQQSDDGVTRTWQQALSYAEGLNLAGKSDWRLPNARELQSLVDYSRYYPSINPVFGCRSDWYWSGSTGANCPNGAWIVDFSLGDDNWLNKSLNVYVRCVRGGPSGSFDPLTIAQTPMSGPPGTSFVQWGTGFTPRSTATFHFKKPDGTEYPTRSQAIDSTGHFEISYDAPLNKPPGTYVWWAVDGPTGKKSNEVSYEIIGTVGQLDHFEFSDIGAVAPFTCFQVTITAKDYAGNKVPSFNGEADLFLIGPGKVNPTRVQFRDGQITFWPSIDETSTGAFLRCVYGLVSGESGPFTVTGSETGTIKGWVTDQKNVPIAGAEVFLARSAFAVPIQTVYSDPMSVYQFTGVQPGTYAVWAKLDDGNHILTSTGKTVTVSGGKIVHPDKLIIRKGARPVVLVPGIMGSSKFHWNFIYPTLPAEMPADQSELTLHKPVHSVPGIRDKRTTGWDLLTDVLTADENYEVFECPYDWRVSMDAPKPPYKLYLKQCIDEAKSATHYDKVDVVAHSMGGLLVRSYLTSDDYSQDIDKLAMVGTPNHGSLIAYYLWEGGDPRAADEATGDNFLSFYTNVACNLYDEWLSLHNVRSSGSCLFQQIPKTEARSFIQSYVPALRQLMPTWDGCLGGWGSHISDGRNRNDWLIDQYKDGNLQRLVGQGVNIRMFGSDSEQTISKIVVQEPQSALLYEDGQPRGTEQSSGDGTVPWERSARVTETNAIHHVVEENGSHASLIGEFAFHIRNFLDEGRIVASGAPRLLGSPPNLGTVVGSALKISIQGRAAPVLTDSYGNRSGFDDSTQETFEEIPETQLFRITRSSSIVLQNPTVGMYALSLNGVTSEEVFIQLSYQVDDTIQESRYALYYPGAAVDFTLEVQTDPEVKLEVHPRVARPESLGAHLHTADGQDMTELSWAPVDDPQLQGYRVYSKKGDESSMGLLATLAAQTTSLLTTHPWIDPARVYAVSAYNQNGEESFLSDFVRNRTDVLAAFSATPTTGKAPHLVSFTDASSGSVTDWSWDFGDGFTSTERNPTHTYASAGSYTVILQVNGTEGSDLSVRPSLVQVQRVLSVGVHRRFFAGRRGNRAQVFVAPVGLTGRDPAGSAALRAILSVDRSGIDGMDRQG